MLEDMSPPEFVTPCAVRRILDNLDEADQKILVDALANVEAWGNTPLARALSDRGLRVSEKPIRKHRAKECSCK
jgi:hypothetical protein